MYPTQPRRVSRIIHNSAAAAATIGAGFAQVPGSDALLITPIQISMVIAIGKAYGIELSHSSATATISTLTATIVGRTTSQFLIGYVPIMGNIINATTAMALTEAIGWGTDALFKQDNDITKRY